MNPGVSIWEIRNSPEGVKSAPPSADTLRRERTRLRPERPDPVATMRNKPSNRPHERRLLMRLALLLVLAGVAPLVLAAAHGSEAQPAGADAATTRTYQLGRPLDGRFDLTTLRSTHRLENLRYQLPAQTYQIDTPSGRTVVIRLQFVLEFGAETGLAEIQANENAVLEEIEQIVHQANLRMLVGLNGKLQLKEQVARALNMRLRTAQVRQVYMTEFFMQV